MASKRGIVARLFHADEDPGDDNITIGPWNDAEKISPNKDGIYIVKNHEGSFKGFYFVKPFGVYGEKLAHWLDWVNGDPVYDIKEWAEIKRKNEQPSK